MIPLSRRTLISGFTIIELLIVVVVIGILSSVVIISYNGVQNAARDKAVLSDAETVAAEITRYSVKNNGSLGSAVAWYSEGPANPNIKLTPSPGNVIDIVAGQADYCIRVYNPGSNYNTITNAATKESSAGVCNGLPASIAAGGSWDASLIGWWKLNGNANDASGNGANGTVNGASAAIGQNGQAANAYSFNGTTNYITIPNTSALQVADTFTVSAWVYASNLSGRFGVFSTRTANSTGSWQIEVGTGSGGPGRVAISGVGVWAWDSNSSLININIWYHIAFTKPNNASVGTMYLNGVALTPSSTAAYTVANNSDPKHIGAGTSNSQYFIGRLDDIRLYNRSLSGSEILSIYNAGAQ